MSLSPAELPVGISGNHITPNGVFLEKPGKLFTVGFRGTIEHHCFWWPRPTQPGIRESFYQTLGGALLIRNGNMVVGGCVNEMKNVYCLPCGSVHSAPSKETRSLKSRGSESFPGRAALGSWCSWHTGQEKSVTALTSFSFQPYLRKASCRTLWSG